MKKMFILLMIVSGIAHAEDWRNGEALFDATKNKHTSISVELRPVANAQTACDAESAKRGYGAIGYGVNACSFWIGNVCTIIVEKQTTQHILGHELRHCFQGSFHP